MTEIVEYRKQRNRRMTVDIRQSVLDEISDEMRATGTTLTRKAYIEKFFIDFADSQDAPPVEMAGEPVHRLDLTIPEDKFNTLARLGCAQLRSRLNYCNALIDGTYRRGTGD